MTATRRAVIYARFSTEHQSEKSTEDQIDLCRTYAAREGLKVVATYADKARSGASLVGRDDVIRMLSDANERRFDVIIVEALDRLSRDMEDLAGIHKRLTFLGIEIRAVHEGTANTLLVGLRGLVGQLYREDNVHKIRRGMTGLVKQGLSAGGKAYGYRPDPMNKGKLLIVEEEAEIVLRVFQEYRVGVSPKAICRALNADGIAPPRGRLWSPSALIGSADRGSGILRNPQYKGKPVWNKVHMVKDPDTGKRLSRPNPESEWLHQDAPELEIVPPTLFDAVQAQLKARANGERSGIVNMRRPVRLLSGLIKCGACGHGMTVAGTDKSGRTRLRCSAHTNSGACPNPKTFYLDDVEGLVTDTLADELATPEQVTRIAKAWLEGRHKEAAKDMARRAKAETRLKAIGKKLERITVMLIDGVGDKHALDETAKELGMERDRLKADLDREPPTSNVEIHPAAVAHFAERLTKSRGFLHSAKAKREMTLRHLHDRGDLHQLVRQVVASVTLSRDNDGRCAPKWPHGWTPSRRNQKNGAAPLGTAPFLPPGWATATTP